MTSLTGRTGGSTFVKPIDGKILLNAGLLSGNNADLNPNGSTVEMSRFTDGSTPLARYRSSSSWFSSPTNCDDPTIAASNTLASSPASFALTCTDDAWWAVAGDDDGSGLRQYPMLPQLPSYTRSGPMATLAGCNIFFPGRYEGGSTLTLTGTNYFASGIYYFERPLVIDTNATVVFGEGKVAGCVFDSDAAFAPTAPKAHEITGRGATLLLGKSATVTIKSGAKVSFNRRVSSASTKGSEGQAIHVVSTGISSSTLTVPQDQVRLSDGSSEPVSAHEIPIGTTGAKAKYTSSTLSASTAALAITLGVGSRVTVDGYVFAPQAKVTVDGSSGVSDYQLNLLGGIAATSVALNVATPSSVANGWFVGTRSEVIQRKFLLTATAVVSGHNVTSQSAFELNEDKSYAINYWTVDA
ncbi:MAG: hypothetical protein R2715_13025 [Ilumatobacteraceae bacterium]